MRVLSESQEERLTARVTHPYGFLPRQSQWEGCDRRPYIVHMPDTLAGLIRQMTSRVLDLGKLGFDDAGRYGVYRGHVFDLRDQMLSLLEDWLMFWGMTDENDQLTQDVLEMLLIKEKERAGDAIQ